MGAFLTVIGIGVVITALVVPPVILFRFWFDRSDGDFRTGFLPFWCCLCLYIATVVQVGVWVTA